jgi:hypothetical protein
MDNLPRLRLSSAQLKLILWLLKSLNVSEVPSYHTFRKMQARIRQICTSEPVSCKSSLGNAFSVNDPRDSVAMVSSLQILSEHRLTCLGCEQS